MCCRQVQEQRDACTLSLQRLRDARQKGGIALVSACLKRWLALRMLRVLQRWRDSTLQAVGEAVGQAQAAMVRRAAQEASAKVRQHAMAVRQEAQSISHEEWGRLANEVQSLCTSSGFPLLCGNCDCLCGQVASGRVQVMRVHLTLLRRALHHALDNRSRKALAGWRSCMTVAHRRRDALQRCYVLAALAAGGVGAEARVVWAWREHTAVAIAMQVLQHVHTAELQQVRQEEGAALRRAELEAITVPLLAAARPLQRHRLLRLASRLAQRAVRAAELRGAMARWRGRWIAALLRGVGGLRVGGEELRASLQLAKRVGELRGAMRALSTLVRRRATSCQCALLQWLRGMACYHATHAAPNAGAQQAAALQRAESEGEEARQAQAIAEQQARARCRHCSCACLGSWLRCRGGAGAGPAGAECSAAGVEGGTAGHARCTLLEPAGESCAACAGSVCVRVAESWAGC